MMTCNKCIHNDACQAWIKHGELLYDDFSYSVEHCPYFKPTEVLRCKDCECWERNPHVEGFGTCCRVDYDPQVTVDVGICMYQLNLR